ncbi:MAG: Magnesium transporter [Candidatus Woesebacteria bacterium GW2011_GWB1_39_12]|uniref:Magnesium transporter n=2 Tax=Candidatus Woeseibacteriota TaxID=1752722 RepID=A0A0G0MBB5_9BACT|nr:MAG: Magnesium transporter [Candidatus Woesebacteria bacterium GW2011_GWA1_39_12]KKR01172.1 MAG: Magnesium transporter [Candidatus Woesebacteria bacterium GW2011_GWB1_39_12]
MTKANLYPQHSIGEHVVPFPLTFFRDETAKVVLSEITREVGNWPNTEVIFVIDKQNKLIGSIEFKKILSANPNQILEKLMDKDFTFLTDHSHQASAIKLAVKEGVESIPVVDQEEHFLGIIDAGQIFKIMHEEHVEKLMHFSGILNNEALVSGYKASVVAVAKSRLPWLFLGLIGGFISTILVKNFAHTLQAELALAFFIPVIVYMNAAVGAQTQIVYVRYSAFEKINFIKALLFEIKVIILLALSLSLAIYLFTFVWLDMKIAVIVSVSMFLGMLSSAVIGTLIPWVLERLGKDPAIGSGPFTTIIQDLLSIVIYFSIASVLL